MSLAGCQDDFDRLSLLNSESHLFELSAVDLLFGMIVSASDPT